MNRFEEAKARVRELDKLHPDFIHMVGIRYHIVRVKRVKDVDATGA